jgi:hypothetical protein
VIPREKAMTRAQKVLLMIFFNGVSQITLNTPPSAVRFNQEYFVQNISSKKYRITFCESEDEWGTDRQEKFRNPNLRLSISLMGWFDSPNCCISSPAVAKGNSSRN